MFGRIVARLLLTALRSKAVQTAGVEVSRYATRRAYKFLVTKLRAGSKIYND